MITNTHPLVLKTLTEPVLRERYPLFGVPSLRDRLKDFFKNAITTNGTADVNPISAFELLQRTYFDFRGDGEHLEIVFVDPNETDYMNIMRQSASTVIADDSDYHRSSQGTIEYDTARLIDVDGKCFIIAFGIKGGDYPGGQFAGDLLVEYLGPGNIEDAFADDDKIGEVTIEKFADDMRNLVSGRRNSFSFIPRMTPFSDSIAVAMRDGSFDYSRYGVGSKFSKLVGEELNGLKVPNGDSRVTLYRPEALDVIKRGMNTTLRDYLKED